MKAAVVAKEKNAPARASKSFGLYFSDAAKDDATP